MKHHLESNLAGSWRFRLDPDRTGEHFPEQLDPPWQFDARWMERGYADGDWQNIAVPACWQSAGHAYNGAAWYRRELRIPPHGPGARFWLRFEGVDYFADTWLNDVYLGSHEGFFGAFQYELTPYLKDASNLLAVRVDSPNDISAREHQIGQLKTLLKGALQRWDMNDTRVNPGGIWNDVRLLQTGPGAILGLKVHSEILSLPAPDQLDQPVPARLALEVQLAGFPAAALDHPVRLQASLRPVNFDGAPIQAELAFDPTRAPLTLTLPLRLEQARLWCTWDLGTPCLYEISLSLLVDGQLSDRVQHSFGIRRIERRAGWETYLNGVRFFQRGANYLSDQLLSSMTPERYQQDLELIRAANLNTIHPFCVVEKQVFYDLCDRAGILVYQDFPMWLEMSPASDLVRRAALQLRELVEQFGHHPCIAIWNFGSQPSAANFTKLCSAQAALAREIDPTRIAHQANTTIDASGTRCDPVASFFWKPEAIQDYQRRFDWRADTHQYYGWYDRKTLADLPSIPEEQLQLVTEFGAQALPSLEFLRKLIPAEGLFPPIWKYYTLRNFQPEQQFDHIPQPASLEQLVHDSQSYQARFIQQHVEFYRLRKYRPCNGIHYFCFNDCWPAITWSVLDYERQPKPGYFALRRAMQPLQVLCEFAANASGAPVLWLVNDFPHACADLSIECKIADTDTSAEPFRLEMAAAVEANALTRVTTLPWVPRAGHHYTAEFVVSQNGQELVRNGYSWET